MKLAETVGEALADTIASLAELQVALDRIGALDGSHVKLPLELLPPRSRVGLEALAGVFAVRVSRMMALIGDLPPPTPRLGRKPL